MLTTVLIIALQQADPAAAPEAAPAPAPAPEPKTPDAVQLPAPGAVLPRRSIPSEDLSRELEKIRRLPPEDQAAAMAELSKRMTPRGGDRAERPVPVPEVSNYFELPEAEQVKYSAREFFTQLVAGDARGIVANCGFPFQLEDKRLQSPDELFQEWLRNLRAKRTDLLTLYDVEVLTPADMEKKYGKPPARLANLPWKQPKTYVAVANLSGHAAIAVLRQQGMTWAVVGYHD